MIEKLPHAKCDGCPALGGKLLPPIGKGRRLAIIGEAPTRNDCKAGRIFSGNADRQIGRVLRANGLGVGDIHFTNAVACECKLKERQKAAKHCRPRLEAELAEAEVIVALGNHATRNTVGWSKSTPIQRWRGSVYEKPREGLQGQLVLPLMTPYDVQQTPRWMPIWESDWARVARVAASGFTPIELQPGRRIAIAETEAALVAGLDRINWADSVACDVETVGLGPTETDLVCLGLSDGKETLVVPWSRSTNGREDWWSNPGWVARAISERLAVTSMVTHNGPNFDHIVLRRYGFSWKAWDDTLLVSHVMASHLPKFLSHVVTASGLDVGPWKELEDRSAARERLWIYNGRDTCYTKLAFDRLKAGVM